MDTKNVKVGSGKAVHASKVIMGITGGLCGAGFNFDGHTFRHMRSRSSENVASQTDAPVTCKRCLKALAEASQQA
jgi:hypothetical protein